MRALGASPDLLINIACAGGNSRAPGRISRARGATSAFAPPLRPSNHDWSNSSTSGRARSVLWGARPGGPTCSCEGMKAERWLSFLFQGFTERSEFEMAEGPRISLPKPAVGVSPWRGTSDGIRGGGCAWNPSLYLLLALAAARSALRCWSLGLDGGEGKTYPSSSSFLYLRILGRSVGPFGPLPPFTSNTKGKCMICAS